MRKAPLLASLAMVAGIGGYLLWAYPRLPAVVPMTWDLHNVPVAFGTREAFVGIPAAVTALIAVLSLAATWRQPKAAWLGALLLAVLLFFVHVSVQAVLGLFLPIPVNVAVFSLIPALVIGVILALIVHRRRSTSP